MDEAQKNSPATLRAIAYPLVLDGDGGLVMSYGIDVVRDQLRSALETWQYERVMDATYGLPPSLIFSGYQTNAIAANRIRETLRRSITDPKLAYTVSAEVGEDGAVEVTIPWQYNGIPQPSIEYRLEA